MIPELNKICGEISKTYALMLEKAIELYVDFKDKEDLKK